jgi:glycosyltransferase involved in cell wall biosynthesis
VKAHILQPYSQPDWPLIRRFQERWPDAAVHSGGVPSLRYRTKLGFLAQLPRLFVYGLRIGLAAPEGDARPVAFIPGTDPEVFGLLLAQWLRRKRVPIFLIGFIYTRRKSRFATFVRRLYFKLVLSLTSGVVCHSTLETVRYARLFGLEGKPFEVVPFALNVERSSAIDVHSGGYALSAGRAERDYGLLSRAWTEVPLDLHIVCDTAAPLLDVLPSPRIKLLRACFGDDYFRQIAGADFVVVTLKDKELSAGQMVLLQSAALGKAVIISRTPTTEEYGEHLRTLYFVEHGSEQALRDAVLHLARDPELRARIGAAARERYEERHTVVAYTNGILSAIERMLGRDVDDRARMLGVARNDR